MAVGPGAATNYSLGIGTTGGAALNIFGNNAGDGPRIDTNHDSPSPGDNDDAFAMFFKADDDGGVNRQIGNIVIRFLDVTDSSMDSEMRFGVMDNVNEGNAATVARLTSDGVWTDASGEKDKAYEGSARDVWGGRDGFVVTDKIKQLNIGRYHSAHLTVDKPNIERHVSPTAEQFYDLFGTGGDPRAAVTKRLETGESVTETTPGLAPKDVASVALMGMQELIARVEALESHD
tara:strand:- start:52 stop:750 length:699 start_codon:yes stop_codon:yes gene_type:complete